MGLFPKRHRNSITGLSSGGCPLLGKYFPFCFLLYIQYESHDIIFITNIIEQAFSKKDRCYYVRDHMLFAILQIFFFMSYACMYECMNVCWYVRGRFYVEVLVSARTCECV